MVDQARDPDSGGDMGGGPDRDSTAGTPGWVKAFAIIGVVLVLLVVIMLLAGHGPGRHMHGGLGGHTPPSAVSWAVMESGLRQR